MYDYRSTEVCLIIIQAHDRRGVFGETVEGRFVPNDSGMAVVDEWKETLSLFPDITEHISELTDREFRCITAGRIQKPDDVPAYDPLEQDAEQDITDQPLPEFSESEHQLPGRYDPDPSGEGADVQSGYSPVSYTNVEYAPQDYAPADYRSVDYTTAEYASIGYSLSEYAPADYASAYVVHSCRMEPLVRRFMDSSTARINAMLGKTGRPLWNNDYVEQVITDEEQLKRILEKTFRKYSDRSDGS